MRRRVEVAHAVAVLAFDGLSPFEFSVACEVFGLRRAELGVEWYGFDVCAVQPRVRTNIGFAVEATAGLDVLERADTVVVPGAPLDRLDEMATEVEALRRAAANGARVVSFCSGAFLLGEAGLLDGRRATTHWKYVDAFRARYPDVQLDPNVLFVDEGKVLTGAGTAAGIDLSLHLVRHDHGVEVASKVARSMVVPPHRDGGQAQFIEAPAAVEVNGDVIAPLLDWAQGHLDRDIRVGLLAEKAGMSQRTFARRFKEATGTSPHRWVIQQRLARAQQLLETTDLDIEMVASRSGFGTGENLRDHFRRSLGIAPTDYRRRFGAAGRGAVGANAG